MKDILIKEKSLCLMKALYINISAYVCTYTSIWIPKFNIPLMLSMHLRILYQVIQVHFYYF